VVKTDFVEIAKVIKDKITQIGNFSRFLFYGNSLGARMAIEVGATLVGEKISKIDLCDPAGPGFDSTVHPAFKEVEVNLTIARDPKEAALNVQCIDTSNDYGTNEYKCHQNWRMGPNCGEWQIKTYQDHMFCEPLYLASFTRKFIPSSTLGSGCNSTREANLVSPACAGAKMGFWRGYDTTNCVGDFFAAANWTYPYSNILL
jgi:hypothetical protein